MSKTVGDYQLKEKIGKGSYADVYKGTHKVTGVKYAIKAISKDILSEPKLLAGLESEIKIMREFSHENIVGLHEYFSSEKNFYLVLELCEGGDLSKFIKKKKRLDERLAHKFLAQITSGLAFLHEKNFIHRDLKPANVLLSEFSDNAILKLVDFGFARQLTVASLAQTRCGTPLYMAPEILESKDYDGKADIWSVGCIFYEMLVGTSPFKGTNEADLLVNIKTKELNVPKDIVLSKVSIEILIKLLERHPIRRASLNQLVVLTSHLSSALPPASTSAAGEEEGLALPVPSPNERAAHLQQSSTRRAPETTTPEAPQSRRRYSSTAVSSDSRMPDGMDPNFMSPVKGPSSRGYAGGPAPSNLQGMFSPVPSTATVHATDNFSPSHGGSSHAAGGNNFPNTVSARDGYSNRRYSASAATAVQQSDPSISKTLRAPYVHTSAANKYPSPSSSPPGGMSVVSGGFLQGSSARVQSSQVTQQASSPAATAISMVGNFIANVFNPAPSPNVTMSESARGYQHQQRSANTVQHGRTVSLDRGATTNYYNNTGTNTGYFTGGGGGPSTPPNTHKSRNAQQVIHGRGTIREDHFGADIDGIARNNSGSLTIDDDFVMISNTQSASESDRKSKDREVGDNSGPTRSAVVSASSSGANSNDSSGVVMASTPSVRNNVATTAAEYDMESDARANETAAVQAFYVSIVQRCEVYCAVVSAISALGDQYVREIQVTPVQSKTQKTGFEQSAAQSTGSEGGEDEEEEGIAGFLQPSQDTALHPPMTTQVSIERYLIACSLYLHALSILTRLMKSFETNTGVDQPENMKTAMQKLKSDLSTVFEQLIARAESCQKHIDAVVNSDSSAGVGPSSTLMPKYAMPRAEPVMIQAALRRESDAALEELLGNLNLACKLYLSANELVEGVALTANDPEDQRKLRVYSTSLLDKHAACKKRAAELMIFS